ncbi:MAG: hypothetical protein P8X63_14680, partial [Desulfuromonadaceae bacterium]
DLTGDDTDLDGVGEGDSDGDTCDPDERITYKRQEVDGVWMLVRERNNVSGELPMPIAENIEAVFFEYLDGDGAVVTSIGSIRQVVITVVARTARPDANYTDTNSYQSLLGTTVFTVTPAVEHYRRRLMSVQVECRNIGL